MVLREKTGEKKDRLFPSTSSEENESYRMPLIQLDVKMLPMKVHYFLFMGGVAPMTSFLPTIAKQLGYSTVIVGFIYSILPILSLIIKPVVGAIVDRFRVKKTVFLTFICLTGLSIFSLMFVPETPLETKAELSCNDNSYLIVCFDDKSPMSKCDVKRVIDNKDKGVVGCEMKCDNSDHFRREMCEYWKFNDYCPASNSSKINNLKSVESTDLRKTKFKTIINYYNDNHVYLFASLYMNHTLREKDCFYFELKSAQFYFNESEEVKHTPTCQSHLKTQCQVQCESAVIMDLLTPQTYKGSFLQLSQFWMFVLLVGLFWISQSAIFILSDSICFDQLGNKPNLYSKQRCWGAVGWGIFSIFAGWLVDIFSFSEENKNYLPLYYICLLVLLCSFFTALKLNISETKISTNKWKDIGTLLMEVQVLGFLIWAIVFGICTAMIWQFLFWYIEDVASIYDCNSQVWIKTLQGLIMGVQCLGWEAPIFSWSGWFIKRLGHLNCMSLVLGVFAFRFFAYSILTNPIWVLPIELTSGLTFGLGFDVLMSYANVITLPGTESTMVELVCGVYKGLGISLGSLLGGYLYSEFGGANAFRFFAYGSALLCGIHLICQNILKLNGKLYLPSILSGSTEYASPIEAIHMQSDD